MEQFFRFSTDDVPVGQRPNLLHDLRGRGMLPIEPIAGSVVHVEIVKSFLPGIAILAGCLCGVRQHGTPQSDRDDLFFGINVAGRGSVVQRGREAIPGAGDAFLLNAGRGAFVVSRPSPAQFIGLRVPRAAIAPLVVDLDDTLRIVRATTDIVPLLTSYVGTLVGSAISPRPEVLPVVAAHLHDLIALSVGPTPTRLRSPWIAVSRRRGFKPSRPTSSPTSRTNGSQQSPSRAGTE
jgi:hypothetical protein